MIIKWKTTRNNTDIKRVECTRETEKTLWLLEPAHCKGDPPEERQHSKRAWAYGDRYHDSWEAAHAYLVDRCKSDITESRSALNGAIKRLGVLGRMVKP